MFILVVYLVLLIGVDNNIVINVMNLILGGVFIVCVNMNLCEDKSWFYGVYIFL